MRQTRSQARATQEPTKGANHMDSIVMVTEGGLVTLAFIAACVGFAVGFVAFWLMDEHLEAKVARV